MASPPYGATSASTSSACPPPEATGARACTAPAGAGLGPPAAPPQLDKLDPPGPLELDSGSRWFVVAQRGGVGGVAALTAMLDADPRLLNATVKQSSPFKFLPDGGTALALAATHGRAEVAECLIQHSADIGIADEDGQHPVHLAAYNGHADVAMLLLEANADPQQPGAGGKPPLQQAEERGQDAGAFGRALERWSTQQRVSTRYPSGSQQQKPQQLTEYWAQQSHFLCNDQAQLCVKVVLMIGQRWAGQWQGIPNPCCGGLITAVPCPEGCARPRTASGAAGSMWSHVLSFVKRVRLGGLPLLSASTIVGAVTQLAGGSGTPVVPRSKRRFRFRCVAAQNYVTKL